MSVDAALTALAEATEAVEKVQYTRSVFGDGPQNTWPCNACEAIRQAPCGPVCLPADHYDPREHREAAAVADFEEDFDE